MPTSTTPANAHQCCVDTAPREVSRRAVIGGAMGLGAGMALAQVIGDSTLQASFAGARGGNTLLVLSLRGGVDGLGVVVPHAEEAALRTLRPSTRIATSELVCKDPVFGLHPKLAPLAPLWASGELAAIQAVGLPIPNRSHFAAIEAIEDSAPGSAERTGWINRMVGVAKSDSADAPTGVMDAVQMGQAFPTLALKGAAPVMAASRLDALKLAGSDGRFATGRYASLATSWSAEPGQLGRAMREAVDVSREFGGSLSVARTAVYPTESNATPFASPLKSAAGLIQADLGTDVIAIDAGAWDYHNNYGTTQWGSMQSSLDGLARSLRAFFDDLGPLRSRVTVVTISEFGRRVSENGNAGFDHGWGNMMLVMGAGVRGGRYYGSWPGLSAGSLQDGDLKVTTDYRSVLWELVSKRFPDRSLPGMFPGFATPSPLGFMF